MYPVDYTSSSSSLVVISEPRITTFGLPSDAPLNREIDAMTQTRTRPYDTAEYLETEEDMALYLEAALEDGDPKVVAAALGDIARAHGMTQIAKATGLSRESLYKALSPEGNPEWATILKVVQSLGLQLHARAAGPGVPPPPVKAPRTKKPRA